MLKYSENSLKSRLAHDQSRYIGPRFLESRLITMQDVAVELLCSISSFSGIEKTGIKVVSLHFDWFYFLILTSGFKAPRL